MTLFYRGPCARVTHEVFEVRCPYYQSFAISELRHVHAVHDKANRVMVGSVPTRVCSTALAGASAVVAVAGWSVLDRPVMSLFALVVLAMSSAVLAICLIRRRAHELRGVYHGRVVCLFRTTDSLTFGQVSRALLRVLERRQDAR